MKLLLVEDDASIVDPLLIGLAREGFDVEVARSGRDALAAPEPDLVLLDLGLPDLEGEAVCRSLRERSAVPIIVVTARSEESDRVALLELGADDYVVKPFGTRELVARIRAVLRRAGSKPAPEAPLTIGSLVVDCRRRQVCVGDRQVALSPREFDLLAYLAEDPGGVVPRERILHDVWDPHWWGPSKTLDVHVASLRKKLGDARWIRTVRGVGYTLEPPR